MILILSANDDRHVSAVTDFIGRAGKEFVVWDPGSFPGLCFLSMEIDNCRSDIFLTLPDGRQIDARLIEHVWYRRPSNPSPSVHVLSSARELVVEDSATFLDDLYVSLEASWFPSPPWSLAKSSRKFAVLKLAQQIGFKVPATAMTNTPKVVEMLYNKFEGHIISKRIGGPIPRDWSSKVVRYTELVTTQDIGFIDAIAHCPMVFQEYVPKSVELRVTVVGSAVFAAEIDSQATAHTKIDWRRYDDHSTPYRTHELPDEVSVRCVRLTQGLGLHYSTIDLIKRPDGDYVILEVNPNGQYLWVEQLTGLPISQAIANWLCGTAP